MQIRQEVKQSLFADNVILYIEMSIDSTKKLGLMKTLSEVLGYK